MDGANHGLSIGLGKSQCDFGGLLYRCESGVLGFAFKSSVVNVVNLGSAHYCLANSADHVEHPKHLTEAFP